MNYKGFFIEINYIPVYGIYLLIHCKFFQQKILEETYGTAFTGN